MTYRKKLIEVALPLASINVAAAAEKAVPRRGHPQTIHLWWARRPLAACRAVLFASLVNDPGDDPVYGANEEIANSERANLFNLIEELVKWENSNNPRVINSARAEIARSIAVNRVADKEWTKDQVVVTANGKPATAHDFKHKLAEPPQVNAFLAEHAPPVLDPFCGGGSIPLEAQRLGLRAYASDLNPVPVLITKALIEIPPKFAGLPPVNKEWQQKTPEEKAATVWQGAAGLVEDVRFYGQWMGEETERRIGHFYPKVKLSKALGEQEVSALAWHWARTVLCPNPACAVEMPLVRSFLLASKSTGKTWAHPIPDRDKNQINFEVRQSAKGELPGGTVDRRGAKCCKCGEVVPLEYIRDEGKAGRIGARLLAILADGADARIYVTPTLQHQDAAIINSPIDAPETSLPEQALGFRVQSYGINKHRDLFSSRQLLVVSTFCKLLDEVRDRIRVDFQTSQGASAERANQDPRIHADAVAVYLACAVSRLASYNNTLCFWNMRGGSITQIFSRQTISMSWDFIETNPLEKMSGNWKGAVEWVSDVLSELVEGAPGLSVQLDARSLEVDHFTTPPLVCTDPPYYDNIGYADLSDFFYIWLRRCVKDIYPTVFSSLLVPKQAELVADPHRFSGNKEQAKAFFEAGLSQAFVRMKAVHNEDMPLTMFYAFKQSESLGEDETDEGGPGDQASTGWETMLEAVINTGMVINGTWPIRTEKVGGVRNVGRNSLASSIILVCRPRPTDAPLATRKEFMNALRRELPEALKNLQRGNIAPVDLAQAAIGPGMAVFTRFAKIIETDGSRMTVRTALGIINQVLDEVLAEQEGEFDADTRWALAWFGEFGTSEGPYGVAETLSKAKNTAVGGLVAAGVVTARGGKVQLVSRNDLSEGWDPITDQRLTVWETTQHLIRALESEGESAAAILLNKLGGIGETARDLAYRLYNICERKKWADEALAYNGLVIAWPVLTRLAQAERNRAPTTQQQMF